MLVMLEDDQTDSIMVIKSFGENYVAPMFILFLAC